MADNVVPNFAAPAAAPAAADFPALQDGKAPDAFRTIGEVSTALGLRAHVLRYWEEQFPMLRPVKRAGGRRLYRPDDVALIARIDRLVHQQGYTLRGARAVLEGKSAEAPAQAQPPVAPMAERPAASAPLREVVVERPIIVERFIDRPVPSGPDMQALLADLRRLRAKMADALTL